MRHDPLRFTTFVLGAFSFVYYLVLGYQIVRIRKKIGKSPVVALHGHWPEKIRALGAFIHPLVVLAWAYNPERFAGLPTVHRLENWPAKLAGLWCLSCGAAMLWVAYVELGDSWRIGVDADSPGKLIETGVYSSIRHPVYAAFWLWLLGIFLMAPNILFAILWAAGASFITQQAHVEEQFLLSKFGKPYRDYMLRTGRFFPLL